MSGLGNNIDPLMARRARNREYQRAYRKINADKVREQNREWTKKNREKINARQRELNAQDRPKARARGRKKYAANREAEKDRARAYRAANLDKARVYARRSTLKRRYGITEEAFNAMLCQQEHRCAICRCPFTEKNRAAVDHCHESGAVRGLLCRLCNSAIALLRESPEIMRRAIEYVASARDRRSEPR